MMMFNNKFMDKKQTLEPLPLLNLIYIKITKINVMYCQSFANFSICSSTEISFLYNKCIVLFRNFAIGA